MIYWALVIFILGILDFLDCQFNYSHLFRTANSFLLMLVALGILIRIKTLEAWGFKERLIEKNKKLRDRMVAMRNPEIPLDAKEPMEEMALKKR
jgi:hypothetical protein